MSSRILIIVVVGLIALTLCTCGCTTSPFQRDLSQSREVIFTVQDRMDHVGLGYKCNGDCTILTTSGETYEAWGTGACIKLQKGNTFSAVLENENYAISSLCSGEYIRWSVGIK